MPKFDAAGADAAGKYDDYFRQIIQNDPDIQRVIQSVWGNTPVDQRPSDTPKNLEKKNKAASQQITQILKSKGIDLPDRTFVNPRSGNLEGHRGWSGLNGWQKAAIIAAAAATGVGGVALAGGLGGAAAGAGAGAASGAGAGAAGTAAGLGAGLGVTTGVPAGLAGVGATGIGAGGALAAGAGLGVTSGLGGAALPGATGVSAGGLTGGSAMNSMLMNAGINAAKTKAQGGSWKDALISGGLGAATGGGGNMGWADMLKDYGKDVAKQAAGNYLQQLTKGKTLSTAGQGLGSVAQTMASNRGTALDAMMAGDEIRLAADRERRADEGDILKRLAQTGYITGGGAGNLEAPVSVTGTPFTKFDFGVRPPTEAEIEGAKSLEGQLLERAKKPRELSDYESKMDPGKMETALNWLSPLLSTIGAARTPDTYTPLQQAVRGAATPTPQAPPTPETPTTSPNMGNSWGTGFQPVAPRARNPWTTVNFG